MADLQLDLFRHEAVREGSTLELLPMEFKLLKFLMRNAGRILPRRTIFEMVWGYDFDPGAKLIDVHVGELRRKIETPGLMPLFTTERGLGYMLNAPSEIWRTTSFRLSVAFGLLFACGTAALLTSVHLQAAA